MVSASIAFCTFSGVNRFSGLSDILCSLSSSFPSAWIAFRITFLHLRLVFVFLFSCPVSMISPYLFNSGSFLYFSRKVSHLSDLIVCLWDRFRIPFVPQ